MRKKLDVPKVLYQSALMERYVEGENVEEKGAQAAGMTAAWKGLSGKDHSNVGDFQKEWTEAGVSASRATTHRQILEMGFRCRIPLVKPLLNKKRQKRLTWATEKKELVCCSVVSSPLF